MHGRPTATEPVKTAEVVEERVVNFLLFLFGFREVGEFDDVRLGGVERQHAHVGARGELWELADEERRGVEPVHVAFVKANFETGFSLDGGFKG